jgi:enoyl-[acyl-carrier protein] reductase I
MFCRSQFSSKKLFLSRMAATAASGLQMATARPCISSSHRVVKAGAAILGASSKGASWAKLASGSHISSIQPFQRTFMSSSVKLNKAVTKAMSESSASKPVSGLPIDLRGTFAFLLFLCLLARMLNSLPAYALSTYGSRI